MDSEQRDLALRVIPVLEDGDQQDLYRYICKYFSTRMGPSVSTEAKKELGIIMLSKLRGTYALMATQRKCETYEDIISKVVR
ncbi:hypothetical protein RP20_CCG027815 [Aedes albopictus]|nr:hypothetical protein RP20_CCG027815 [Aedes albopictus]